MSVEWPKKRETFDGESYENGWNACHDAFMKVIDSQPALIPLDEKELGDWISTSDWDNVSSVEIANQVCAKFGQSKEKLVPTDDTLYHISEKMTYDFFANIRNTAGLKFIDFIEPRELMDNVKLFCSRFGAASQRDEVTVEEILDAMMSVYHNEDLKPLLRENSRLSAQAIHNRIYGGKKC